MTPILPWIESLHQTRGGTDGLGRRSQVWLPQRPQGSNPTPSESWTYAMSASSNSVVGTTSLLPSGGTTTTYTFYDALLRPRQTQAPAEGGGILVSGDTLYNTASQAVSVTADFYTPGTPGQALSLPVTTLPGQTITGYDGDGRTAYAAQLIDNVEKWRTSYTYGGDHVDVDPPTGGTPTTTTTDARGNTTALAQYHGSSPTGAADTTHYTYNAAGQMTSMTDPGDDTWTWTYDVLGRPTATHDPDAGDTTRTYDAGGRLATATDGNSTTLAYSYDTLDRKTGEYLGTTTGTQLAGWTYDTVPAGSATELGQPATSTRYVNGTAFATDTVNSYDAADRATSMKTVIASGVMTGSYVTSHAYEPDGQIASIGHNAYAGLSGDGVTYGYTASGRPTNALGAVTGTPSFVGTTTYSATGQVDQINAAIGSHSYSRAFTYQDGTDRLLTDHTTSNDPNNIDIADHTYTYDSAGLLTQDQNAVASVGTDNQCYTYNSRQELTAAWTPSGKCNVTPTASLLAGPAPYWQTYKYDTLGDRTSITNNATDGTSTTSDYAYPAPGTTADQPNAVTSVTPDGQPATPATSYTYDNAGNTLTRPGGQSFTWDPEGHLATATVGNKTQSDIYDADGDILQQSGPTGTTLYLGDTEVHAAAGSTTLSLVRTYTFMGQPVAERTTTPGVSGSTLTWLIANAQGTVEAEINSGSGAVVRRHTDPFGNNRDTNPFTWSSDHAFLNAPSNDLTGTTHLGARDYDPTLGKFLSVDPQLDPGDPLQNNGYTYAWNNPIGHSDPTGLRPEGDTGDTGAGDSGDRTHCPSCSQPNHTTPSVDNSGDDDGGGSVEIDTRKVQITYSTIKWGRCVGHCIVKHTISLYQLMHPPAGPKNYCGSWSWLCTAVGYNQVRNCIANPSIGECLSAAVAIASDITFVGGIAKLGTLAAGALVSAAAKSGESAVTVAAADLGADATSDAIDSGAGRSLATCGGGSFRYDTQVVMADGSTKPIDQIRVGDKVRAVDTHTGKAVNETVTTLWVNHDTDLMDITIRTGSTTSTIHTTQDHLFWIPAAHRWVRADQIVTSDALRADGGAVAAVVATSVLPGSASMWDLTVDTTHDFFVITDAVAVLVHNNDACALPGVGDTPTKVVNSNLGHVDLERAQRAGFSTVRGAGDAVRALATTISEEGFPVGTIPDTACDDRVLVPIGSNAYAVYQIAKNGNAVFKTILTAK